MGYDVPGNKADADAVVLSNENLAALPEAIERPEYDRSALTAGMIHIGLGNFHRAHQAWYLHRLMQAGKAHDWAILGAGVREYDAAMRERLLAQDCLTTLIQLSPDATSAEVTGAMIDYLPIQAGNVRLIKAMSSEDIRIVSLTVTEGGYYIDPATSAFDADHDDIRHDAEFPEAPRTAFGAIIRALSIRRAAGVGPFTVQSCDNLLGNGDVLRQTVVSLAQMSDVSLADWISENVTFPNSMVDCIVPATGPVELGLAHNLGVNDQAPVTHENFRQWVVEDKFCAGRPPWEDVGVTITDNVHAYEEMKIRVLNAGHQVIANAGEILGLPTIASCMSDADVSSFFYKVAREEIAPHVAPVPELTPSEYVDLCGSRFANPAIKDTTRRVAFDGSSRHTGFVLPTIREALEAGAPIEGLSLVEALWARMCAGTREDGRSIEQNDPNWSSLTAAALDARATPSVWLDQRQFYGELRDNERFVQSFSEWLRALWSDGTRATLQRFNG